MFLILHIVLLKHTIIIELRTAVNNIQFRKTNERPSLFKSTFHYQSILFVKSKIFFKKSPF